MRPVEPPRVWRSMLLQLLALAAIAVASEHPWSRKEPPPVPPKEAPPKEERRIRVVRIEPARKPPESAPPPRPAAKQHPPPAAAARPAHKPALPVQARIAADSTAVQGVRLRVLVPRSADALASHLRNSGGCLVVSRLTGEGAEVVSVLAVHGARAVEVAGPPCAGVPRLVRDAALNDALGDPLGRARASAPGEDLVLQVLLTPHLTELAQATLQRRFGAVSAEEMGRRAAESGYELTCFAEPAGAVRCQ